MKLSNPLPDTWRAILCAEDAFKITRKVIIRSPTHPNEECRRALESFQSGLRNGTIYEGDNALRLLEDKRSKPSQINTIVETGLGEDLKHTIKSIIKN